LTPTSVVVARYFPDDLDALQEIAAHYHGPKGQFAYTAFRWANTTLFADRIPTTLIQWGLTAFGKCMGFTRGADQRYPVIMLHTSIWESDLEKWQPGPRMTLDVVIHECLHAYIFYVIGQDASRHSSHDSREWAQECMRLGPLLGLPAFTAAPTKRIRENGRQLRRAPEGCLPMNALSTFPYSCRPPKYYEGTTVPWQNAL
jgi:hypothetical protein